MDVGEGRRGGRKDGQRTGTKGRKNGKKDRWKEEEGRTGGTEGQEEDRDRGTGAVEAAGGFACRRTITTATTAAAGLHGHRQPPMATALWWPRTCQGTSSDPPVTPLPAEPLHCQAMGATAMGATMMGPGTAVWGAANHGQRPHWVALVATVATPQHGPTKPRQLPPAPAQHPREVAAAMSPASVAWRVVSL